MINVLCAGYFIIYSPFLGLFGVRGFRMAEFYPASTIFQRLPGTHEAVKDFIYYLVAVIVANMPPK